MSNLQQRSNEQKLRALSVHGGTRQTSLRLDGVTWSAIDYLAAREGIRWQDWASRVIDTNFETNNMAAELRQAAIQQLLDTIGQGSNEVLLPEYHAILGNAYSRVDDATLAKVLDAAFILHRDNSFVSFSVIVGFLGDAERKPFLCVQNHLQGAPHLLATIEGRGGLV